jgi:hypothetical protein
MKGCGLIINNGYNFVHQSEKLLYMGKEGRWHQFTLTASPHSVWCELLDSDLHLIEETKSSYVISESDAEALGDNNGY